MSETVESLERGWPSPIAQSMIVASPIHEIEKDARLIHIRLEKEVLSLFALNNGTTCVAFFLVFGTSTRQEERRMCRDRSVKQIQKLGSL